MEINELEKINVTGISVRTTNANEMTPANAKIGALWEKFYTELAPKLSPNSQVFGLYTNYESDHTGAFDVVACSDVINTQELESFQVNSGKYLVFSGVGEMPQAVISLWGEVWNYFSSADCQYERAFTTDFELYKSETEIEIYIAIN